MMARLLRPLLLGLGSTLSLASGATPPPPAAAPPPPPWKDPLLPLEKRLDDLLPRLSEAELLSQLSNSAGAFLDQPTYEFGQECLAGFDGGGLWASQATDLQTFPTSAVPHAVSLGMSFDKALVRSVAAAIGSEARAGHTHFQRPSLTCQSPVLNVARDPRWGRCMESYGEDGTVIAKLGAAYVTGIQHGDVGAPATHLLLTAASPKHFADYNLECTCFPDAVGKGCDPENPGAGCRLPTGIGRNAYDANISAHDMRETYLMGWTAVAADIQGFMCASNSVNGIPLCAHKDLLDGVMRKELGMTGAVISDGNGVTDLFHQPSRKADNPINGRVSPYCSLHTTSFH
jgi:beta-glucosidase